MKNLIREILKEYDHKSFYDNPRKVIINHPQYNDLIKKLKGIKSPIKLKENIEDWILSNEEDLAKVIFQNDVEDFIYCEHAAEMVGQILDDLNLHYTLMVGNVKKQSHAWVVYDGIIIDPTKSQFRYINDDDYYEDVYWTKRY